MNARIAAAAAWTISRSLLARAVEPPSIIARAALDLAGEPEASDAVSELATSLRPELAMALKHVGMAARAPKTEMDATTVTAEGILLYDARFADHLETFGDHGRDAALQVRRKAAERRKRWESQHDGAALWELWIDDAERPMFAVTLAFVLWRARVKACVSQMREMPGALAMPVHGALVELTSSSRARSYDRSTRQLRFHGRTLAMHAAVDEHVVLSRIQPGLQILRGIVGHRVLRWLVLQPHRQFVAKQPRFDVLHVQGGASELRAQLGFSSKRHETAIRDVIDALADWTFDLPAEGRGNLLVRQWYSGRSEHPRLVITVGEPLLPLYQRKLQSADRRLVPMLRQDPPFCGSRPNERGAEITMALAMLAHFRDYAEEYARTGAVHLPHRDGFAPLADRAGVPRRSIAGIVERWVGDKVRPLLEPKGRDRYALSSALSVERECIMASVKR